MPAIRCPRNFRSQSRSSWPKESPPYYDYPSAAHRRSYARRTGAERGFATLKDPASNDISRGWCHSARAHATWSGFARRGYSRRVPLTVRRMSGTVTPKNLRVAL